MELQSWSVMTPLDVKSQIVYDHQRYYYGTGEVGDFVLSIENINFVNKSIKNLIKKDYGIIIPLQDILSIREEIYREYLKRKEILEKKPKNIAEIIKNLNDNVISTVIFIIMDYLGYCKRHKEKYHNRKIIDATRIVRPKINVPFSDMQTSGSKISFRTTL